jgi:hypothetical protein
MKLLNGSPRKPFPHPSILPSASLVLLLLAGCITGQKPSVTSKAEKEKVAPAPPLVVAPTLKKAKPAPASFPEGGDWLTLFDGKTLKGWAVTDFSGHGEVRVKDGKLLLENGVMTGVTWTNDIPRMDYAVELEAMRVDGSDFFCALTFPVGKDPCSLIVGGWGGGLVGLSSLDGEDASSNETTKFMNFENGRWYKIRLLVKPTTIQAWIDGEKLVDVVTTDRKISVRSEVEQSIPFGIATYSTTGAIRNLKVRQL